MNISYDNSMFTTEAPDNLTECTQQSCDDCCFDCEPVDPWAEVCQLTMKIFDIFNDKGFNNVDYDNWVKRPGLQVYLSQSEPIIKHLEEWGYTTEMSYNPSNQYRGTIHIFDEFGIVDPKDIIHVLEQLGDRV